MFQHAIKEQVQECRDFINRIKWSLLLIPSILVALPLFNFRAESLASSVPNK